MTSYTNTFTGAPIQVTPTSLRAFTIGSDTTLSWPENNEDNANITADTMEVTASSASLSLLMPPANQVSNGKACLIRNVGANTFTVKDNAGNTIQSIAAGNVFWVYVKDNSTVAGTWSAFQFGTGTSAANAADLDGNGLSAIGSLLNVAFPVNDFNSNFTLNTNYRATIANWTGGAGTFSFDPAATLGNNWFIIIKNSGSGALTLDPASTELIDGVSTISLNAGESCIVACTGTAFLSFCKNSTVSITFTRLVKSVAGSSNVTLTAGEAGYDIQEYTGLLTGNISVIVPTAVSRWWVYNNTTGSFSLTVKTAAGTGIAVTQGTRQILHCDGTNVVKSVDSGVGTVTSIATGTGLSGGPITTSGTINIANTAVSAGTYGGAMGVGSITVNAQGQLTAASFTARSITGTTNRISVTNGDGVSGAPTIDIAATYVGQTSITTLGTITTGVWNGTTIAVANGGTGTTSLTANNVLLGNGTSALQVVAPGTSGNVLQSNGTTWVSTSPGGGADVQTFNSSGTWNKPSGYSTGATVLIELWGGGGGGGGSSGGGNGGASSFGSHGSAYGGSGASSSTAGGAGGNFSNTSGRTNDTIGVGYGGPSGTSGSNGDYFIGGGGANGNGGAAATGGSSRYGGGGGGTGGGAGGSSIFGGNGGAANTNGTQPGGGGGGQAGGHAGSGGGGGSYSFIIKRLADLGSSESVTVGAGGSAGSGTSGASGAGGAGRVKVTVFKG